MLKLNYKKLIILILLIIILISLQLSCFSIGDNQTFSQAIVIYGDSRTNHQIHQKIVNEIIKIKPAIVFHAGDLVENGLISDQWVTFNDIISDLINMANFYPALGNHENNSPLYFDNFVLPHLPFSTGPHTEDEKGLRQSIVPLFEQHDVDIVFNGHDHNYERSLYNNIYYIVTGGGGAPLYDQSRISSYSQKFIKAYHFCKLTLINNQLIVEVYDIDLNLVDQFAINQCI